MPEQPPVPLRVVPVPGSRLEQLVGRYELLKARAQAAKDEFEACTDGIKAEVTGAYPGQASFVIAGSPHWPALKLNGSFPWRLNTKLLKEAEPRTYVRFAERSQNIRWELRPQDGS